MSTEQRPANKTSSLTAVARALLRTSEIQMGFTLIEVLVALAILSVSLLATYHVLGLATREHAWLQDRTLAHWVATNRLAELQLATQTVPPVGVTASNATQGEVTFTLRQEVRSTVSPWVRVVLITVAKSSQPDYRLGEASGFIVVNPSTTNVSATR